MKLFPRLVLLFSGLLTATILALSSVFYWTEQQSFHRQAEAEQRAIATNLVHLAQESLLSGDDLLLVKYTRWIQQWNPGLLSASVVGPTGEVLAHSEPTRIGKPETPLVKEADALAIHEPVRLGTHVVGTASASFSRHYFADQISRRMTALRRRLIPIALVALVAVILLSLLLALSWTRPISRLAAAAGRIGQGRYDLDITDLEKRRDEIGWLSKSFQRMVGQLRELDEMKEDFVSAVTHELRSPLGAIESYLNLASEELEEGISKTQLESYLDRLRSNTRRLTHFVNDLLDVAAIERGKVTLDSRRVSLNVLIDEVAAFFSVKMREKAIAFEQGIPLTLPAVWADEEKIRQVLTNLLSNAIKFTPEGGRIRVSVEALTPEILRIAVRDTGVGMTLADQQRIFNKFEQVHAARRLVKGPKGTGLGLAICRALVERHGGTIGVDSQPGEGSTFFFTLPVVRTAESLHLQEDSHGPSTRSVH